MTVFFDKMTTSLSLSMCHSYIAYLTEQLLLETFFDLMLSSESDEMTAMGPIERKTFTFYVTF